MIKLSAQGPVVTNLSQNSPANTLYCQLLAGGQQAGYSSLLVQPTSALAAVDPSCVFVPASAFAATSCCACTCSLPSPSHHLGMGVAAHHVKVSVYTACMTCLFGDGSSSSKSFTVVSTWAQTMHGKIQKQTNHKDNMVLLTKHGREYLTIFMLYHSHKSSLWAQPISQASASATAATERELVPAHVSSWAQPFAPPERGAR